MAANVHDTRHKTPGGAGYRGAAATDPEGSLSRGLVFALALSLPVWASLFYLMVG